MIHTPNIIDVAVANWRQLVGTTIRNVEAFSLRGLDELSEIVLTAEPSGRRFHVGAMQEDGKLDNVLFYWLSIRDASHFKEESLVSYTIDTSSLTSIVNAEITSIELFGHVAADAVYASLLQTEKPTIAIATTCWLPNKQRFAACGSDELAVLDPSDLHLWLSGQGLELIAEIT